MKKYVKPELFYENYELSQYIASCIAKWNHGETGCSVSIPNVGTNLFNAATAACTGGTIGGINCYQNGSNEGPYTPFIS